MKRSMTTTVEIFEIQYSCIVVTPASWWQPFGKTSQWFWLQASQQQCVAAMQVSSVCAQLGAGGDGHAGRKLLLSATGSATKDALAGALKQRRARAHSDTTDKCWRTWCGTKKRVNANISMSRLSDFSIKAILFQQSLCAATACQTSEPASEAA